MIEYTTDIYKLSELNLDGFFVDWPNPPKNETFKKILEGSYKVVMAYEGEKLIGFINCISDGILSAYIPLLEVLPTHKEQGVGKTLIHKMKNELKDMYMVDLLCDESLIPYYENLGMIPAQGACMRNYDRQSGE